MCVSSNIHHSSSDPSLQATSEADLPICAPHAVCSKIDVYDVPYIERQCVCPQPVAGAPLIYQYNMDSSRSVSLQKHLENVQRSRPQRILDLTYNVRNEPEEAYLKELMHKLSTNYDLPEIIFEDRDHMDVHGGRLLRKRKKVNASHKLNNAINSDMPIAVKKRHTPRSNVPKIGGCSALIGRGDGHTIVDKTRQYKLCEPVNRLEECDNFGHTWSVKTNFKTNITEQEVFCRCKKNSVTYLTKREELPNGEGYAFLFNCAPQNVSVSPNDRIYWTLFRANSWNSFSFRLFLDFRTFGVNGRSPANCFRCGSGTRCRR